MFRQRLASRGRRDCKPNRVHIFATLATVLAIVIALPLPRKRVNRSLHYITFVMLRSALARRFLACSYFCPCLCDFALQPCLLFAFGCLRLGRIRYYFFLAAFFLACRFLPAFFLAAFLLVTFFFAAFRLAFFLVAFFLAAFFLVAFRLLAFFLVAFFLVAFRLATFFLAAFFLVAFLLVAFFLTTLFLAVDSLRLADFFFAAFFFAFAITKAPP